MDGFDTLQLFLVPLDFTPATHSFVYLEARFQAYLKCKVDVLRLLGVSLLGLTLSFECGSFEISNILNKKQVVSTFKSKPTVYSKST